jgi:hypothetical protein
MKFLDGTATSTSELPARRRGRVHAQEILVGESDYPTDKIGENARAFRQLGSATRTSARC